MRQGNTTRSGNISNIINYKRARRAGTSGGKEGAGGGIEQGGAGGKKGVLRGKARNGCGGANHLTFRAREVILKLAFVREWSSEGRRSGG